MTTSARETVFASIRRALGVTGAEATRRAAVAERLREHPRGVIPARGQLPAAERVKLFVRMVEAANGSAEILKSSDEVPAAIAALLRRHNLPMQVRRGDDPRLAALPWDKERQLEVTTGASDGRQLVSVSHAFGGVAETGTLVMTSGTDNPTTLNFLPDTHVVVLRAKDVAGDYETVWARVRDAFGTDALPRSINLITGPSRSADIAQILILGAHGPRRLHVLVVDEADG
ncbi:MAG TPA: lactate utilization protein [Xanthobacteraceae bacterium]|nr:lactate utilization protein [Xanthobacteraceae bacterium]